MGMQKAIAAVIGGLVVILNSVGVVDFQVSPELVNSAAAVLTALAVYFVPNSE